MTLPAGITPEIYNFLRDDSAIAKLRKKAQEAGDKQTLLLIVGVGLMEMYSGIARHPIASMILSQEVNHIACFIEDLVQIFPEIFGITSEDLDAFPEGSPLFDDPRWSASPFGQIQQAYYTDKEMAHAMREKASSSQVN